jgi:hypothetical protein
MSTPSSPAGPSTRPRRPHPHPERVYTGPDPSTLAEARTRTQADKYFARVANDNILPNRYTKALGFGGWFFGGGQSARWKTGSCLSVVSVVYMALFADFGDKEHVFSPVCQSPQGRMTLIH